MKKHRKLIAIIISVALIMTIVPIALFASAADVYEPYVDAQGNPKTDVGNYYITSASDLQKLSEQIKQGTNYGASSFKMTGNIDMTDVDWTPIGTSRYPFESEFDGNGFYINNLSITDEYTDSDANVKYKGGDGGVFGYVSGTVKNLHVDSFNYSFGGLLVHAGGIAANLTATGTIINCSSTNGKIAVRYSEPTFTTNFVGGIVGRSAGKVEKSFSTAEIIVDAYFSLGNSVGGVVGQSTGTVLDTYFVGNVVMGDSLRGAVGGIVGTEAEGAVSNSYNVGIVGGNYTGGIVGTKGADATISNCYYCEDSAEAGYFVKEDSGLVANNENTTLFTVSSPVTANDLGDAFKDSTLISRYKFPELKNNIETPAAIENVTEFAGGNGTLYNPYQIENATHLNNVRNHLGAAYVLNNDIVVYDYMYSTKSSNIDKVMETVDAGELPIIGGIVGIGDTITREQLRELLESNTVAAELIGALGLTNADALLDGIFVGGFKPIGTTSEPFSGIFNGNGKKINNVKIDGTELNNALFIRNYGTIKDFTLTSVVDESASDYSARATVESSVNVVVDANDKAANAAAIVAVNDGLVKNVSSDVDVTITTPNFKAHAAGIVSNNLGVVDACQNTGVILVKYADDSFIDVSLQEVASSADLIAAGVVAVNEVGSTVKNSKSSNSARSELTSASPNDGIYEGAIVAKDLNSSTTTGNTTVNTTKPYLAYNLPEAYASVDVPYATATNEIANPETGATYGNLTGTVTATPAYGEESENYQPVTITFTDGATEPNTFRTTFLAWVKLDPDDVTINSDGAKKSFLVGDEFSTKGLSVVVNKGEPNEYDLKCVSNSAENGYTYKVFNGETDVTSTFSQLPEGTYTVKLYYAGELLPNNNTYQVKVYDVNSIEIASNYDAYMVGQKPSLYVRAEYADPDRTAKELKTYDYYICNSEAEFSTAIEKNGTFGETGDKYIGVKYTKVDGTTIVSSSNTVKVTVLPADVKVTNLIAKTSSDEGSDVKADSIKLEWTDDYATKYKVERTETPAGTVKGIATTAQDVVTDNTSIAGSSYTYKVTMYVAGELSTGSATVNVTAPMPQSVKADVAKATKYIALGQPFTTGNIPVVATFKNNTTENLRSTDTDDANATTKYYVDSSAFNTDEPGSYTIKIKYMGSETYNGAEVGSYSVEVVPPIAITAEGKYDAYPVGYPLNSLKDSINVEASYDQTKIKKTYKVASDKFDITGYTPGGEPGNVTLTVKHVPYTNAETLSANVTLKFVPNVSPTNVTATAGVTGINTVTWNAVEGAVSYNVYRNDGTETTKIASVNNALTYEDKKASPGATYTYTVSAVIADQETAQSTATEAVTTVAPKAIVANATNAKKDFAVGQNFTVSGLTVVATYEGTDETRELKYSSNNGEFNYYVNTAYDKNEAGTYTVDVTYKGSTTYNSVAIGSYEVTVYPVYKLTITMDNDAYPKGYPLSYQDFTVKAIYGEEGKDVKTAIIDEYEVIAEPNMNVIGEQSITVKYSGLTATAIFNIYDPTSQIEETSSSGYVQEQDGRYLNKVAAGTSVSTLKNNLENNNTDLRVFKSDGTTEVTSGNVGTGYVVKLYSGDVVVDSIIIVVPGDVNGDAKIASTDYIAIKNHIMGSRTQTGCYKLAADANGDGQVKATDYVKVKNIIMGR